MYEIRPETVKTFITDRTIRLPRFQRKQTWDEKKNFELCVSLFKDYPLGVTIVNVEKKDGLNIRWLLDGRQRRNALVKMYEDPENIYRWAKKYIKFKNNSQPNEIRELFWNTIYDYVEDDEEDDTFNENNHNSNDEDVEEQVLDSEFDYEIETPTIQFTGLDFLLEIILMIHNKKNNSTGFTKPFDISNYVEKLKYIEVENGKTILSSKKLKTFIDQYRSEYPDFDDPEAFYNFIEISMNITSSEKLKKHITNNWKDILYRINMIERLDSILSNSKIGIIEVKEIKFADSQKIFNIINTKGEKLSAVEVLSAKPSWNNPISNEEAPEEMKNAVAEFYKTIDIRVDNSIVKWDLPATFLRRIGQNIIIQSFDSSKPNELSKELTYGFKLLSGIWENGIKKDDIDKLSKDRNIFWISRYESLISEIKLMLKTMESFPYFQFFKTWRTSMMELTNDSIALNFFILSYKDWERKGKPCGSDNNSRVFAKNCFLLWDKLIYEYLSLKWKGSGDSKIGKNISEISNAERVYSSVSSEEWIRFLEEIHEKYTIFGEAVSVKNMKPILYHFYCLKSISGPDTIYSIEVDHIIPQDVFKSSSIDSRAQDSLFNLGLLPKNENISKSNKRLYDIHNTWLIDQIKKYEFVDESDFSKYSNIENYSLLYDSHYELFKSVFDDQGDRNKLIYY